MDISIIADYSSILSLILSIILLIFGFFINNKIKRIRNKLLFDKGIPKLVKDLENKASSISCLMNDFENNEILIKNEISLIIVIIENIRKKISKNDSSYISNTIKNLKEIKLIDFKSNKKVINYYLFKHQKKSIKNFR